MQRHERLRWVPSGSLLVGPKVKHMVVRCDSTAALMALDSMVGEEPGGYGVGLPKWRKDTMESGEERRRSNENSGAELGMRDNRVQD